MGVLNKGKSIYPFWGESINLITGLDPLGMQLTSESTYDSLLPGISNLTNRMRYYGFYCWLLDFYFSKESKGNSKEQNRFIRRAELMVALIMQTQRPLITQITGSDFAHNLILSSNGKYFDLAEGADQDSPDKKVYWKYPSGAFGQYYYGAMNRLSLVKYAMNKDNDLIYVLNQPHKDQKVSGKQLAEAFDTSLTQEVKDIFYNNIKKGKLQISDIPLLDKYFAIDKIDSKSPEWLLYLDMLLDKDEPGQEDADKVTYHRKETIIALLKSAVENKNIFDWNKYFVNTYNRKLGDDSNPASSTDIGWYSYHFNEHWQYACGAIFWSLLLHLYDFQQDQYLPTFIKSSSNKILEQISEELNLKAGPSLTIKKVLSKQSGKYNEELLKTKIVESIKSENAFQTAMFGFLLLFQLLLSNKEQLNRLEEFMKRSSILRDGNMVDGISGIDKLSGEPIQTFVEHFVRDKILFRHQMVALRKIGNGTQATFKFIIEDQNIRFIENYPPRNTSPRMISLKNLLSDLQIIDDKGKLTQLHHLIIA